MARPRHAKRSGLLARLFPGRTARREAADRQAALLRLVAAELRHLRELADAHAESAARAEARALAAEEQAAQAAQVTATLRTEVARLREELLWAWAEGRLPAAAGISHGLVDAPADAKVIDLRATGS
ncbi:MAG TPA: hypothetical protein VM433_02900 [Mycobacteriales bacterium]|nr:hypothetical protein [Mycobacteriales bacterium]